MTLYHGSLKEIHKPQFGLGNPHNDYGLGFYCTENLNLAKEWGCTEDQDGVANQYSFNCEGLSVLDLSSSEYNILHWLTILLQNRVFDLRRDIAFQGMEYLKAFFSIDYANYDVIKGYRADDSYFSFADAFLNNIISIQKLNLAMHLGQLGVQIVLKSEKSFEHLSFEVAHPSQRNIYYPKKYLRDQTARADFSNLRSSKLAKDELFLIDLIRQEVTSDDESLRRILSL